MEAKTRLHTIVIFPLSW